MRIDDLLSGVGGYRSDAAVSISMGTYGRKGEQYVCRGLWLRSSLKRRGRLIPSHKGSPHLGGCSIQCRPSPLMSGPLSPYLNSCPISNNGGSPLMSGPIQCPHPTSCIILDTTIASHPQPNSRARYPLPWHQFISFNRAARASSESNPQL